MLKNAGVTFSMKVSPEEKAAAEEVREKFTQFIENLDDFTEFFKILFESLDKVENGRQLLPIALIIKKYQIKLLRMFNNVIRSFGLAIFEYGENFTDTEMDAMRDIILQNMAETREDFIDLMKGLDSFESDDFIADSKKQYAQINKYLDKVKEVIQDEWFAHIDYDILGKIRLSSARFPLSKKG